MPLRTAGLSRRGPRPPEHPRVRRERAEVLEDPAAEQVTLAAARGSVLRQLGLGLQPRTLYENQKAFSPEETTAGLI